MFKSKGNVFKLFFAVCLSVLAIACCGFYSSLQAPKSPVFANEVKAYSYEVSNNQGAFMVVGYYTDDQTYVLSNAATSLSSAMALIKNDGINTNHINFLNVNAGNDNLLLDNVNYTIEGSITFATISADACIQILGGSIIQFSNATISNNGISTLITVLDASFSATGTNFSSEQRAIQAENATAISLDNCTVYSHYQVAISASNTTLNVTGAVSSQNLMAVLLSNSIMYAVNCSFNAQLSNYAIYSENSDVTFGGTILLNSKKDAIYTDTTIDLDALTPYTGVNDINIYYAGQIGSSDVLVVSNVNSSVFANINLLNYGYTKRLVGSSLYLAKQYTLTYDKNCVDSSFIVPTDTNKYFNGESITLIQMSSDVRNGFTFVGWSLSKTSTVSVASVTIDAENITVYAIFTPIDYTITYEIDDEVLPYWQAQVQNDNPATYTYAVKTDLTAPTLIYHDFVGYKIDDGSGHSSSIVKTLSLPYETYHDVTITLYFELTTYAIEYSGLTEAEVTSLNLKTDYNIESEELDLSSQSYLLAGKSFYGLKSQGGDDVSATVVSFSPFDASGFPGFETGQTLTIVVDTHAFHNGIGRGTKVSPYILTTYQQYYYLLTGQKLETLDKVYINFGTFIQVENSILPFGNVSLCDYVIDGKGYGFVIEGFIPYKVDNINTIYSVLPNLENCTISNLTVKSPYGTSTNIEKNALNNDFVLSGIAASAKSCIFKNVKFEANMQVSIDFADDVAKLYVSGFVHNLYNSALCNCEFLGSLFVSYYNAPNTAYIAGFSAMQDGTMLLNCTSKGTIAYVNMLGGILKDDACIYAMGFSLLKDSNIIMNCVSKVDMQSSILQNTLCTLSGFAVATGKGSILQNCFSDATYNIKNGTNVLPSNQNYVSTIWSVYSNFDIINCFAVEQDDLYNVAVGGQRSRIFDSLVHSISAEQKKEGAFISKLNANLTQVNSIANNFILSNFQDAATVSANKWYVQTDDDSSMFNPTFTLFVYSMQDKTTREYVYSKSLGEIGIITKMYTGYLVKTISLDRDGKNIVSTINTLDGDSAFVYVAYQDYMQFIWSQVDWVALVGASALCLILLIVMFVVIYRNKKVVFIFDGKVIFRTKARKDRKFVVPKDKKHITWFLDKNGTKPMLSEKMPFTMGDLILYSFSDEVRIPLERAYLKKQADKCAKKMRWLKENNVQRLVRVDEQQEDINNEPFHIQHKKQKPIQKIKRKPAQKTKIVVATDEKGEKIAPKKTTQQQLKEEMEKVGVQIVQKQVVTLKKQEQQPEPIKDGVKLEITDATDTKE